MLGKPIFLLIDKLLQKELEKFKMLLNSGFLRQSPEVILLWNILIDIHQDKNLDYTKKDIHKIIYPKLTYKDDRLRLLHSELLKCIEQFIAIDHTLKDKKKLMLSQIQYYKSIDLPELYEQKLKKYHKLIHTSPLRNNEYQKNILSYELEQYDLLSAQKRNQELNLQNIHNRIDEDFYAQKLRWACLARSHQAVYQTAYHIEHIDLILSSIKKLNNQEIPTIVVYASCYQMITEDSRSSFESFIHNLDHYYSCFDLYELKELYLLSINFCIRHLNKGDKDFGAIGLELYQKALEKDLLLNDHKLSRFTYRNIAMMAIRVGDYTWAENFSESYKGYLDKEHQQSSYYFNVALIQYNKGKLNDSLEALIHVDFKDPLIHLAAKTLQLKLYFELKEWQLLDYHLDTMQMYLIRKKILGYHKQNYKNIIKFTKQIINLKEFDKQKKENIIAKIQQVSPLTEKKWLLNQLIVTE